LGGEPFGAGLGFSGLCLSFSGLCLGSPAGLLLGFPLLR
jgi:hypothetical protein